MGGRGLSLSGLPLAIVTVSGIDPTRVQGSASLRHVTVAEIGQSPTADAHTTASENFAVAEITRSYVDVRVIVRDVMMGGGMKNRVLSRRRSARKGLQGSGTGRVTAKKRLHRLHGHLGLVVGQRTSPAAAAATAADAAAAAAR